MKKVEQVVLFEGSVDFRFVSDDKDYSMQSRTKSAQMCVDAFALAKAFNVVSRVLERNKKQGVEEWENDLQITKDTLDKMMSAMYNDLGQ